MEKNNSYTVTYCFTLDKYTVIALDRKIDVTYSKVLIDGLEYKTIPCYDIPMGIAFEANKDCLGKTVYLIK